MRNLAKKVSFAKKNRIDKYERFLKPYLVKWQHGGGGDSFDVFKTLKDVFLRSNCEVRLKKYRN